jgi:hypothetical protein
VLITLYATAPGAPKRAKQNEGETTPSVVLSAIDSTAEDYISLAKLCGVAVHDVG